MDDIQKADPNARRRVLILAVIGIVVGVGLVFSFESYRTALLEWILSEPGQYADKLKLVLLAAACVLSAPLIGFAAYYWILGARVSRAQQYPPPAQAVMCDTLVLHGPAAIRRGIILKAIAVCMFVAAVLIPILFWRIATVFAERAG